jgi:hypothetical protein
MAMSDHVFVYVENMFGYLLTLFLVYVSYISVLPRQAKTQNRNHHMYVHSMATICFWGVFQKSLLLYYSYMISILLVHVNFPIKHMDLDHAISTHVDVFFDGHNYGVLQ